MMLWSLPLSLPFTPRFFSFFPPFFGGVGGLGNNKKDKGLLGGGAFSKTLLLRNLQREEIGERSEGV